MRDKTAPATVAVAIFPMKHAPSKAYDDKTARIFADCPAIDLLFGNQKPGEQDVELDTLHSYVAVKAVQ